MSQLGSSGPRSARGERVGKSGPREGGHDGRGVGRSRSGKQRASKKSKGAGSLAERMARSKTGSLDLPDHAPSPLLRNPACQHSLVHPYLTLPGSLRHELQRSDASEVLSPGGEPLSAPTAIRTSAQSPRRPTLGCLSDSDEGDMRTWVLLSSAL